MGELLSLTKTQCPQGGPHLAGSWKSEGNKVCKSLSTVSGPEQFPRLMGVVLNRWVFESGLRRTLRFSTAENQNQSARQESVWPGCSWEPGGCFQVPATIPWPSVAKTAPLPLDADEDVWGKCLQVWLLDWKLQEMFSVTLEQAFKNCLQVCVVHLKWI